MSLGRGSIMVSLDIGCGARLHGDINIDLPYLMAKQHSKYMGDNGRVKVSVYSDAHYLPFKSDMFDEVFLIHTLEHLIFPFGALREIRRIMKKDGVLHIEVPNPKEVEHEKEQHLYSWHPDTLNNMVVKAGFKVVKYTSSRNQTMKCLKV